MGGNTSVIDKQGQTVPAQKIQMDKVGRSNFVKEYLQVFEVLDKKFKQKYKKSLFRDFATVRSGLSFNGSSCSLFNPDVSDEDYVKFKKSTGDGVVIVLVTSTETTNTRDLRYEMLKAAFPNLEIMHSKSGNLIRLVTSAPKNINVVLCGTDRVQDYKQQLKTVPGVAVKETPRSTSSISATKVIANINDERFFKANTPRQIHKLYDKIKATYRA
jgi:hypothetical protein